MVSPEESSHRIALDTEYNDLDIVVSTTCCSHNDEKSRSKQVTVYGAEIHIPPTWQYQTESVHDYLRPTLVLLNPSCSEHKHVCCQVRQRYAAAADAATQPSFSILDVFRVQNLTLLRCYRAHFEQAYARNSLRPCGQRVPDSHFEQLMFHGTSKSAFLSIVAHGFNTKRASSQRFYGHAVYASKWASYSMRNFCPAEADGSRYLLLVHVIVGLQGQSSFDSFIAPHGCDTGCETEDPSRAEMAMIFHDAAVLPVYCVRFRTA